MHKYTKFAALLLSLIVILTTASCTKDDNDEVRSGDVQFGSIENNVYTNEWLDVSFSMPEGSRLMSAEEIQSKVQTNQIVLINNGTYTKEDILGSNASCYYDFGLVDSAGAACVYLAFVDTNKESSAYISAENYIMGMQKHLKEKASYTVSELSMATIAQKDYTCFSAQTNGHGRTTFYVGEHDHTLIVWTVLYYDGQTPNTDSFIASITKINTPSQP